MISLSSPWVKSFIKRFQNHLARQQFLPRRSKILVAVSGGPDSVCLLSLLHQLSNQYQWKLYVVHINYGLRGQDADKDELFVKDLTKRFSLPLRVYRPRFKPKQNIEARLRSIRYAYFEKLRQKLNFDYIVTGHTQNDLAETVLLNLLRGAGPIGLSPFMRSHSSLVRPLISFERDEVIRWVQEMKLTFREDKSNRNLAFTRNRIRYRLIPMIKKDFNPNIIATLARTAEHCALDILPETSLLLVERCPQNHYRLDRLEFLTRPLNSQRSLLFRFLKFSLGYTPNTAFLSELHKTIVSKKNKIKTVKKNGLKMRVTHATIEFAFEKIKRS